MVIPSLRKEGFFICPSVTARGKTKSAEYAECAVAVWRTPIPDRMFVPDSVWMMYGYCMDGVWIVYPNSTNEKEKPFYQKTAGLLVPLLQFIVTRQGDRMEESGIHNRNP